MTDPKAFEKNVRGFLADVLAGRRAAAAARVAYPLRVNGRGRSRSIAGKTDLLAAWDTIFPPEWIQVAARAIPHDMFVHDGQAMVASGIAWFDGGGLRVVNQP